MHGKGCLLYTPILLLEPQTFYGIFFLQTIIFVEKYLIKFLSQ